MDYHGQKRYDIIHLGVQQAVNEVIMFHCGVIKTGNPYAAAEGKHIIADTVNEQTKRIFEQLREFDESRCDTSKKS